MRDLPVSGRLIVQLETNRYFFGYLSRNIRQLIKNNYLNIIQWNPISNCSPYSYMFNLPGNFVLYTGRDIYGVEYHQMTDGMIQRWINYESQNVMYEEENVINLM